MTVVHTEGDFQVCVNQLNECHSPHEPIFLVTMMVTLVISFFVFVLINVWMVTLIPNISITLLAIFIEFLLWMAMVILISKPRLVLPIKPGISVELTELLHEDYDIKYPDPTYYQLSGNEDRDVMKTNQIVQRYIRYAQTYRRERELKQNRADVLNNRFTNLIGRIQQ